MVRNEKKPYGYIYRATNSNNEKNYIGQTVTSRWDDNKIPIKERWKEEIRESYSKKKRGEELRRVENAIIKHGSESFDLREQDTAYSQEELDAKETYWIKDYDSMNPDKGYNMTEGGLGGRPSDEVREKLSKIGSEKWQEDLGYKEKQMSERQERAKNPEFIEKMTKINQEKGKNPEWREKMSQVGKEKWNKDPEYRDKQTNERRERAKNSEWKEKMTKINQERAKNPEWREKMSQVGKEKWNKDPEYRDKQTNERRERAKNPEWIQKMKDINRDKRKEIKDKREFLKDIKEKVPKKEMLTKYGMGKNTFTKRIQEMFGPDGPKNYTELKDHLQDKNVDEVLKDIDNRSGERQNSSSENTNEEKEEETSEKSKKEEENEKQTEETTEESNEESRDEREEETSEPKSEESQDQPLEEGTDISAGKGEKPTETPLESQPNKSPAQSNKELNIPERFPPPGYVIVGEIIKVDDNKSDIKHLDGGVNEQGKDYDGIDNPQEGVDKDYDKIDESYGEGGHEG